MSSKRLSHSLPAALIVPLLVLALASCSGGGGAKDEIFLPSFATVIPFTSQEVDIMIRRAAEAVDSQELIVAVVDRVGRPRGIWSRNPAPTEDDANIALSIARTGAFMSSSQGPITSRTLRFISTFHYPPLFGGLTRIPYPSSPFTLDASLPSQFETPGVEQTPQGPLWQIFSSNRGAPFAGIDLVNVASQTVPPTLFSPPSNGFGDMRIPPAGRIDVNGNAIVGQSGTGLSYLPGGMPICKTGTAPGAASFPQRVVGGIGVYVLDALGNPDPQLAEFVAIRALGGIDFNGNPKGLANFGTPRAQLAQDEDLNFFFPYELVPPEGAIFLVGILLPYTQAPERPAGVGAGNFANGVTLLASQMGGEQPWGWIIGPRPDPLGHLSQADVAQIVNQGIATANGTRATIRLPIGSATKMIFAVTNLRGEILGAYRMEDSPIFSYDVSVTKARCVTYLSSFPGGSPNMDPADAALLNAAGIPTGMPGTAGEFGVAITTRTLGFLTQPFFPPGIQTASTQPGPLFDFATQNALPAQFNRLANAAFAPGLQSGIIFFPGSAPLYKNGILVGGFGVSGDGVEQDDFVTAGGYVGFEPPASIRADQFSFEGVALPYFKFPQIPGPGAGH